VNGDSWFHEEVPVTVGVCAIPDESLNGLGDTVLKSSLVSGNEINGTVEGVKLLVYTADFVYLKLDK
jgi:hypothetical protein